MSTWPLAGLAVAGDLATIIHRIGAAQLAAWGTPGRAGERVSLVENGK